MHSLKNLILFQVLVLIFLINVSESEGGLFTSEEESVESSEEYLPLYDDFGLIFKKSRPRTQIPIEEKYEPKIKTKLTYGEPCTLGDSCDESRWLKCKMNVCNCSLPSQMTFDPSRDRCVGKITHPCHHFSSGPFCKINSECKPIDVKPITYTYNLRSLSTSMTRLECTLKPAKMGEICESSEECSNFMDCIEGKCNCNEKDQFWDENLEKCVIKHGGSCEATNDADDGNVHVCVQNSVCKYDDKVKGKICKCQTECEDYENCSFANLSSLNSKSNTEPTLDKIACKGVPYTRCNETKPEFCNQERGLKCIDGRCLCEKPLSQTYNRDLGRCVNLVGSNCSENIDSCTYNADCNSVGVCKCEKGYIETHDRQCSPGQGHEEPCTSSGCNMYKGLLCQNGMCQCPQEMGFIFDLEKSACIALEGGPCGFLSIGHLKFLNIGCARGYLCTDSEFDGYQKCLKLNGDFDKINRNHKSLTSSKSAYIFTSLFKDKPS